MLKLFIPKKYIKKYSDIDIDDLKKNNIKLVICDIDNTLVAHDEKHPDDDVKVFINKIQSSGFDFCLISNNFNDRVTTFAKDLNVKTYPMAKKPFKLTYKKIMKELKYKSNEIACIGDQILTDVLGGNRVKIYTVLTQPLVEKDLKATKINRKIENIIFKELAKKGHLVKGEFND